WTCIPLALIVACSVVMSYPWANNLVYRVTGNQPPPPQTALVVNQRDASKSQQPGAGSGPGDQGGAASSEGRQRRYEGSIERGESDKKDNDRKRDRSPSWDGLNEQAALAEQRVPGWRGITLRLPGSPSDPNLAFSIDSGNGGRPDKRAQLTVD